MAASMTQKHIVEQNIALQEKLDNAKEDVASLRGEVQDLEDTLERTEKGQVFLKGLLNNLNEQNKLYKDHYKKFRRIFTYEQYIFFALIVAFYAISVYRKDCYLLISTVGFCIVSKYTTYYENKSEYTKFITSLEVIEKTIDPLHELIDSN